MSRPKNFSELSYQGMDKEGNQVIFEPAVADALIKLGQRIALYKLDSVSEPPKRHRKAKKTTSTPAPAPQEPDNAPSEATENKSEAVEGQSRRRRGRKSEQTAKYQCKDCGETCDELSNGKYCPNCASENIKEL